MKFAITEKQLRMGIAAAVAVVLTAICVWVLLPGKNVADGCTPTGRTASGELIYPVDCNQPTGSVGNSAPYRSGVSNQRTPSQQRDFERLNRDADRILNENKKGNAGTYSGNGGATVSGNQDSYLMPDNEAARFCVNGKQTYDYRARRCTPPLVAMSECRDPAPIYSAQLGQCFASAWARTTTRSCGYGKEWIAELAICGIPPNSLLSKMPSSGRCNPGSVYSWELGSCVPQ